MLIAVADRLREAARETDLVVVAPATADLMAKMANGLADDLASAVMLATGAPHIEHVQWAPVAGGR